VLFHIVVMFPVTLVGRATLTLAYEPKEVINHQVAANPSYLKKVCGESLNTTQASKRIERGDLQGPINILLLEARRPTEAYASHGEY
jgi:hypothetical protein